MKNPMILTLISGLTALSFHATTVRRFAAPPFHYDSVKVTSDYRFSKNNGAAENAYARIRYPLFQDNSLNGVIKSTVLSHLKVKYAFKNNWAAEHPALSNMDAINNSATDYREWAAKFLQAFESQVPSEELKAYWYADIQVNVLHTKPGYFSMICIKNFFTGGQHDLYEHQNLNYDVRNHHLFTLQSQLNPGHLSRLSPIADRIFRKKEGLKPTQDMQDYFFDNGQFTLPDNFTITSKGILFLYDYYEIKPFAAGTTELLIPFPELKGLVLPGSMLAEQMHGS